MRKICFIGFLILIKFNSFSQNLDLIVRVNGDSIACRIDSITDSLIYFEVKVLNKWTHMDILKSSVKEFQYSVINPEFYDFKQGTSSYIISRSKYPNYTSINIQEGQLVELERLIKAQKLKKTGAIFIIAGSASAITGIILAITSASGGGSSAMFGLGFGMLLVGTGVTVIGIPILITGSSRVKRINKFTSKELSLELTPCSFHMPLNQNYQAGISARLRF